MSDVCGIESCSIWCVKLNVVFVFGMICLICRYVCLLLSVVMIFGVSLLKLMLMCLSSVWLKYGWVLIVFGVVVKCML